MDTRDQTLTKLTRLHDKSHPTPSLSNNPTKELLTPGGERHRIFLWRSVDDDDDDESPSPEPRTDSRSALSREIRAWRRLGIVKRDETFSLIFFSAEPNI